MKMRMIEKVQKATIWVLMLTFMLVSLSALAEPLGEIDKIVDQAMQRHKVTGGSVVIYLKGKLVYARDYGCRRKSPKEPVDEHTYFRVASITKFVTGIGLMRLKEQGFVDLDADISIYLGGNLGNSEFPDTPITLRQLMSHTSSIHDQGGYGLKGSRLSTMLSLANRRTSNFVSGKKPGASFRYSNFGAGIVGAVMEAVTGQSINTAMNRLVFEPLGIEAAYSATLIQDKDNITNNYTEDGGISRSAKYYLSQAYEDFADPDAHFRYTVGGLWIRSRDLAKRSALMCGKGEFEGVRLLSPESVVEMMAEQKDLGKSVTGKSRYGLFMEHTTTILPDKMFYGHQGISPGSILNTFYEPESGFVIVVLTNGSTKVLQGWIGTLARSLIKSLYPMFVE